MLSGRSIHESSDEPCTVGLAISEYAPNGRTIEGLTDTSYREATDPWVVKLPINCRTVKVCNGTPFQVWNQQRYGPDALLAAVTLELGEDCSFERMLVEIRPVVPTGRTAIRRRLRKRVQEVDREASCDSGGYLSGV